MVVNLSIPEFSLILLSLDSFLSKVRLIIVYLGLIGIGFVLLLVFSFLGNLLGGDTADVSLDSGDAGLADSGDIGDAGAHDSGFLEGAGGLLLKFASPLFLSLVMIMIGALGLITLSLGIPPNWSVGVSIVLAIILSIVTTKLIYKIFKPSPSVMSIKRFEGVTAEVELDIGPGNKLGKILIVHGGEMVTFSAKSADGKKIPKGSIVKIEQAYPTVMIVRKLEEDSGKT